MTNVWQQLEKIAREPLGLRVALVNPDVESLQMVKELVQSGLIRTVFVGSKERMMYLCAQYGLLASNYEIVESEQPALTACELYKKEQADIIMKGNVHTDDLVRALIKEDLVLPGRRLSHLYMFSTKGRNSPLFVTDPSINLDLDVTKKIILIENAVDALHVLGYKKPKVAIISSVEYLNPKLQSSVDAHLLTEQFSQRTDCSVHGPLALDNAVSKKAAKAKGLDNEVAGAADLLLMPSLDAGNAFCKGLVYLAEVNAAGLLLGLRPPVVFTSRSASTEERLQTLLFVCFYWKKVSQTREKRRKKC